VSTDVGPSEKRVVRSVGVRELKQRTSEVLRKVRQRQERVEVTLRGEVVAMLVPVGRRRARKPRASTVWTDVDRLAREVTARWPRGIGAAEAVSEGRRG
jgi:prevent-host-death family protein